MPIYIVKKIIIIFLLMFVFSPFLTFAALPAGFEIQTVTSGLNLPTTVAFTEDGRIFIAEKNGTVKVVKNGLLLPTPLIELTDVNTYGDRGLIGMAVDPNFAQNGYVYLLYTYENTPGFNIAGEKTGRLVRITVTGDVSNEGTKVVLLGSVGGNVNTSSCDDYAVTADCIPSDSLSHSVGGLRFGPDGKLYVTLGDGASFDYADVRSLRAQDLDSLAGKMLRINTDGTAPSDNPYYNGTNTANRSKVHAYGFRNAFRFNFRPSNGALFAGDVGWSTWEEVDLVGPGQNFGWPCREGGNPTPAGIPSCTLNGTATDPLHFYGHDINGAGSVTGGAFPTGSVYPSSYLNTYFFGDYAQNWIKTIDFNSSNQVVSVNDFGGGADGTNGPVEFVTGPEGNIYFLAIYTGELNKITHTSGNRQPIVSISATPTSGLAPLNVDFTSVASDPDGNPITYLWNFGDNATSSLANPSHTYSTNGPYLASLSVFDNQGGVTTKNVNITVGNQAPIAIINSPSAGSLYLVNQVVQLNGTGTDPETGVLPGSSLSWRVILHHNTHLHIIHTATGTNPTFVAPDHTDPDVYTEVELTVTDPAGLENKTSINMYLNNNTNISGNLVLNPSVENPDSGNPNQPENWLTGFYGISNPVFTYPVAGHEGQDAIRLNVTGYSSGDAKWYFSPVTVEQNKQYKFSHYYKSNTTSYLTIQIGLTNGSYNYLFVDSLPPATLWTKVERVFTSPANVQSATVFHALAGNGELTTDNFDFRLNSTSTSDVIPPTVSVTSPLASSTVFGVINLTANSSDNVAVSGVKFLIDNVQFGAEDSTPPYTIPWNSASVSNGVHTVRAVSRDTSNNFATSTVVSFNVSNSSSTTSANLILNPSLEVLSTTTAGRPYAWSTGKWGTNTATFTYPSAGQTGNGIKIDMTAYTNGDAKWFPSDIPVTPGKTYNLSWYYKSNVTTSVALRYTSTTGALSYPTLASSIPSSTTWKQVNYSFTVPSGMSKVTVFHLIRAVGVLETDEFSLVDPTSTTTPDTTPPSVSITSPTSGSTVSGVTSLTASSADNVAVAGVKFFIDNTLFGSEDTSSPYSVSWDSASTTNGAHTVFTVSRDTSGNTATSTIVGFTVSNNTATTSQNLINNGDMEIADGASPLGWSQGGWGNNTSVYTYPVVGHDGKRGAGLTVTNYVDGDIKWFFTPVAVSPGTLYRFSDYYRSSTISDVIGRYTLSDGSVAYFGLVKEITPTSSWTQVTKDFTPPVGVTHVTFFHLISANGYLDIDDASLVSIGTTTPATDLTPPTVSILTPTASSTVSGIVNITANSTDNVGVTYVVYALNGNIISPNLTTPPYVFSWDSNTVSNGAHTLKATTHDAAGNNTFTTILVNVNNTVSTTTSNLIENPSFEITDVSGDPQAWSKGGWGTNTRVYNYPVAGRTTPKAVNIVVTNYSSGDAKWYFTPKTIVPGSSYNYSNYYTSSVPTNVTARYTRTDGTFLYVGLANLPASAGWTQYMVNLVPPVDTIAITVFHSLISNGSLTVDDYSLTLVNTDTNPNAFSQGMVSLTFDDGWLSQYTSALPILNSANMDATFGIVSLETLGALPENRILNPSFETVGTGGDPENWFRGGWGTNNRTLTYPVSGRLGASTKATQVSITSYNDGDAKWFFADTTVINGQTYTFSNYYKSDVTTYLTARYNIGNTTYNYVHLATLPPASDWTQAEVQFVPPTDTISLTIFHSLNSVGTLVVDDYSLTRDQVYVSPSQVLEMQSAGHEISSHTRTHASLPNIPLTQMQDEVNLSKSDLLGMGVTPVNTFIYPYGDYNTSVISAVQSAGYIGARSVDRGYNDKATNKYTLKIQQINPTLTLDEIKAWIDVAYQNKTWLILMFHEIDTSGVPLSATPATLQAIVDYITLRGMPQVTMTQGIQQMNP